MGENIIYDPLLIWKKVATKTYKLNIHFSNTLNTCSLHYLLVIEKSGMTKNVISKWNQTESPHKKKRAIFCEPQFQN